jgi:small-conductance mechanosensitive channel
VRKPAFLIYHRADLHRQANASVAELTAEMQQVRAAAEESRVLLQEATEHSAQLEQQLQAAQGNLTKAE